MRASVLGAVVAFDTKFEGKISYMYLDVLGLVTTSIGCLIDPISSALRLPWLCADGTRASLTQITQEWTSIKANRALASAGHLAAQKVATLHLDDAGMSQAVQDRLASMEAILVRRFPDWEQFPADAQLGLLSMSWAMGPWFHFPMFEAAVRAQDWNTAALQDHMDDTSNPGLVPRNAADGVLFRNAARAECYETLYWPRDLCVEAGA